MKTLRDILKSSKKYIICDYARACWGKSATTLDVIKILDECPCVTSKENGTIGESLDRYAEFVTDSGIKIAVVTQGDPDSRQEEYLKKASNEFNADVIICTARTRGETVDNVCAIAKNGYDIIWFQNFSTNNPDSATCEELNKCSAVGILKLVGRLKNITELQNYKNE